MGEGVADGSISVAIVDMHRIASVVDTVVVSLYRAARVASGRGFVASAARSVEYVATATHRIDGRSTLVHVHTATQLDGVGEDLYPAASQTPMGRRRGGPHTGPYYSTP